MHICVSKRKQHILSMNELFAEGRIVRKKSSKNLLVLLSEERGFLQAIRSFLLWNNVKELLCKAKLEGGKSENDTEAREKTRTTLLQPGLYWLASLRVKTKENEQ